MPLSYAPFAVWVKYVSKQLGKFLYVAVVSLFVCLPSHIVPWRFNLKHERGMARFVNLALKAASTRCLGDEGDALP